jgi:hypothetical protein
MPYCKWGPEYRPPVYGRTSEFFSSALVFSEQACSSNENLHTFKINLHKKAHLNDFYYKTSVVEANYQTT